MLKRIRILQILASAHPDWRPPLASFLKYYSISIKSVNLKNLLEIFKKSHINFDDSPVMSSVFVEDRYFVSSLYQATPAARQPYQPLLQKMADGGRLKTTTKVSSEDGCDYKSASLRPGSHAQHDAVASRAELVVVLLLASYRSGVQPAVRTAASAPPSQ